MKIEDINKLIDKWEQRTNEDQSELVRAYHYVWQLEAEKRKEYKEMGIRMRAWENKQRALNLWKAKWEIDATIADKKEELSIKINNREYERTLYGNLKDSIRESINWWKFINKI